MPVNLQIDTHNELFGARRTKHWRRRVHYRQAGSGESNAYRSRANASLAFRPMFAHRALKALPLISAFASPLISCLLQPAGLDALAQEERERRNERRVTFFSPSELE